VEDDKMDEGSKAREEDEDLKPGVSAEIPMVID